MLGFVFFLTLMTCNSLIYGQYQQLNTKLQYVDTNYLNLINDFSEFKSDSTKIEIVYNDSMIIFRKI